MTDDVDDVIYVLSYLRKITSLYSLESVKANGQSRLNVEFHIYCGILNKMNRPRVTNYSLLQEGLRLNMIHDVLLRCGCVQLEIETCCAVTSCLRLVNSVLMKNTRG